MKKRKILVIGAGIGGLAAAYWVRERGYDVEILEASDRPGGRMATIERNGDLVDVGAQFYHSNYHHAFELMRAMNLENTRRPITGKVRFSFAGGSTLLYNPRVPYMKMLGFSGNLKLYWFILNYVLLGRSFPLYQITRDIPEYDGFEAADLYRGPSDKKLNDFLVTLVSMADNMGLPEWMSLYHYIHRFRITIFTRLLYLSRGVASLPEELAKSLTVRYESPVRKLVVENGRVVGVEMQADGSIKGAGHVVVAVPPPSAARIMPQELDEQKRFFDEVIYSPFPMPIFFLDRPLQKDVWCYFSDPGLRRTFMFAVDESAKAPEMNRSGKSVVTGWAGHPKTLDLIGQSDETIITNARADIEMMIPGFSNLIEEARVFRHPYGVARYPVGAYRRVIEFLERADKLKGVSFVSSVFGGSSMEAAILSAKSAVSRICAWGGTAP